MSRKQKAIEIEPIEVDELIVEPIQTEPEEVVEPVLEEVVEFYKRSVVYDGKYYFKGKEVIKDENYDKLVEIGVI